MDEETFAAGPLRPRNDYQYPENDVFVNNNNNSSSSKEKKKTILFPFFLKINLFIWLFLFIPPQRTHLTSALEEKMRLNYPKDSH